MDDVGNEMEAVEYMLWKVVDVVEGVASMLEEMIGVMKEVRNMMEVVENSGYSREYCRRFIVKEELDVVVTGRSAVCRVYGGRVIDGCSGINRENYERSAGCSERSGKYG